MDTVHECDRQTDRRTDRRTDRITITKTVLRIASHGKNEIKFTLENVKCVHRLKCVRVGSLLEINKVSFARDSRGGKWRVRKWAGALI